jgi:hypothetical protein
MKMKLTTNQAARMLCDDKNAKWSWDGALALVEYLEELELDAGEEMEFDAVGIRCEWSEYASLEDAGKDLGMIPMAWTSEGMEGDEVEELWESIRDGIRDDGHLIEFDGGVIVSRF